MALRSPAARQNGPALARVRLRGLCRPPSAAIRCRPKRVHASARMMRFESRRALRMPVPVRVDNPARPLEHYLQAGQEILLLLLIIISLEINNNKCDYPQDADTFVCMCFDDASRRQKLAPDTWRVRMLPMDFLWLNLNVSSTLRAWGNGEQLSIQARRSVLAQ